MLGSSNGMLAQMPSRDHAWALGGEHVGSNHVICVGPLVINEPVWFKLSWS